MPGSASQPESSPTARVVVLLHTLPDGLSHTDWFFERPGDAHGTLRALRVSRRPDDAAVTAFEAFALPDHRRAYLDYEGPISRDRGRLVRLASGIIVAYQASPDRCEIAMIFGEDPRRHDWIGRMVKQEPAGGVWEFARAAHAG